MWPKRAGTHTHVRINIEPDKRQVSPFVSAVVLKPYLKSRDLMYWGKSPMHVFRNMNPSLLKSSMSCCCCIWRRLLRTSIDQSVRRRPRRAVMYVPGADRRKMDKVRSLDVDSAVLDLEDGVALNQKVGCARRSA